MESNKEEEMIDAICKLKLGKAPGRDSVRPEMINYTGDEATKELRTIMNEVIKSTRVRKVWNDGIIILLY